MGRKARQGKGHTKPGRFDFLHAHGGGTMRGARVSLVHTDVVVVVDAKRCSTLGPESSDKCLGVITGGGAAKAAPNILSLVIYFVIT